MRTFLIQSLILGTFLLSASGCGGGGARTLYVNRVTTVGQELSDLQTAHTKGAISDEEYAAQKARILRGDSAE